MRRSSIAFPIALILLGALFLASNLFPQVRVLDLFSRYWPFLLIGYGTLRSAELVLAYQAGRPLPTAGLSSGEWFLAVFLVFVGGGIAGFTRFARNFPADRITVRGLDVFGEAHERRMSAKVTAPGIQKVIVDNQRGDVRIVATDASEVSVNGSNTIRAFSEQEADKIHNDLGLTAENQNGQVLIRTNHERAPSDVRISSDIEVTVPRSATVECRGRYGDFEVVGVNGNVEVNSDNAGVRLQDLGGNVRIDLRRSDLVRAINVKGAVDVKGRGSDLELENIEGPVTVLASYSGELMFRNLSRSLRYESSSSKISFAQVPGFVRLSRGELMATRINGPSRIESNTKDVRVSEFSGPLEVEVDRGDVELRPGKSVDRMNVTTDNGEVDLVLPEAAKFNLDARVDRGEAQNDWGAPFTMQSEGRGAFLKGANGSGPTLNVRAKRGSVTLRKSTGLEPDWELSDAPRPPRSSDSSDRPRAPRPPSPPSHQ